MPVSVLEGLRHADLEVHYMVAHVNAQRCVLGMTVQASLDQFMRIYNIGEHRREALRKAYFVQLEKLKSNGFKADTTLRRRIMEHGEES